LIPLNLSRFHLQQLENQLKQVLTERKEEKLKEIVVQFIEEKLLSLFDGETIWKFDGQKNSSANDREIQATRRFSLSFFLR
jgi:hypothetical protein